MHPSRAARLALLLCTALVAGCITRPVHQPVYKEKGVEVFLRAEKRLRSYVEQGFDHPVTISAVRMTHILSRLDIRKSVEEGNRRAPAIPTDILYSVAEGLTRSLERASANQEAVVMAVRKERTLRILDQDYLTSFVAYVRGDQLYIHLARSDWFVPDNRRQNRGLPEPQVGEHPTKLKLYGGTAMTLLDTQSVAVFWRDPIFSRATRTKILPTGEVKRKTILLESRGGEFTEEELLKGQASYPVGLTPGQLRALADVEEARAAGLITEAEYRLRVQEILDR